jgi:hypothetical protein
MLEVKSDIVTSLDQLVECLNTAMERNGGKRAYGIL